jgi:hypothetical protein
VVRPHRSLAILLAAGALSFSAEARAQYTTLRSVFGGAFEYTDNSNFVALNAVQPADRTAANEVKPRPAFTMNLNPSVIGSLETPRSLTELQYTLNFATAFGIAKQVNYTNRLEVRTRYDLSDITVANVAIRATQGEQNMYPEPQPGQAVQVIIPGKFGFGTLEVAQGINHRISQDVAFTEQGGANLFYPTYALPARPKVFAANFAAALQYNDDPTNYALTFNTQLAATESLPCDPYATANQCGANRTCAVATRTCVIDADVTEAARQAIAAKINAPTLGSRLAGNVRHDFKNGFTAELDLGAQQLMRLTDAGGQNWQPAGRIAIRFAEEDLQAGFTFNHGTQLNIDLGAIVLADNVDLVGVVPVDRQTRRWVLQMQAGYQRATLIDGLGKMLPGFQVVGGDVALAYRPENWLPNMAVALRYQIRFQVTEPNAVGSLANYELYTLRNAVGLTVGFELPERKPAP